MGVVRSKGDICVEVQRIIENTRTYFRTRTYTRVTPDNKHLYSHTIRLGSKVVAELTHEATKSERLKVQNRTKTFDYIALLFPELKGVKKHSYLESSKEQVNKALEDYETTIWN